MKIIKLAVYTLLLFASLSVQATEEIAATQNLAATPILSGDQMYDLLVYAIIGSLGVLGLLLGLDKVIIMLFKKGNDSSAVQKYSSESVAKILPVVIEGITVILVILTVIILGVSRTISAEGTLGILGSIVGYVLGKSSRKDSGSNSES